MVYIPSGTELLNPFQILKKIGVGEKMKVVDLGCGTMGHFVFPASHLVGEDGAVYAIDILKPALQGIESKAKLEGVANVHPVWSDIEILGGAKIKDGSMDIALLVNVSAKEGMIKEAMRLIKKGGKLLVVDWGKGAAPLGPPVEKRPDVEKIKTNAKKIGLRLEHEFKAGQYHFGLIFTK
ncbi:MAG: methyltransferase domain-containing protein [Patescibacteria group bacterium]|nr:methyltransferase domain-containing protein [Patescibacteria group bacterium]